MTYARRFLLDTSFTTIGSPSPQAAKAAGVAAPPEGEAVQSDFVVILAALVCAVTCLVGLVAVARCAWLRRGVGWSWRFRGHPSVNKGLKKKVLQSLPKYTYDSSSPAENGKAVGVEAEAECPICLMEYADGDEIRVLPQCGHGFHVQCIDTWLGSHSTCPSCRQILARCRKCGEIPVNAGVGDGGGQTEVKPRQDLSAASTSTSTSTNLP